MASFMIKAVPRSIGWGLGAALCGLAVAAAVQAAPSVDLYHEPWRPQFHFTPPQQWMNDPNGMVYDHGEYHLFYQYHPYSNTWGPMHWGHALSRDLVHWEHLPIALYPDVHGTIFSGSAILDEANTSGFGTKLRPPLVAMYTYNDHLADNLGKTGFQTQGIAYSIDHGRNWIKYAGNPVLTSPTVRDFRDPKLVWHASTGKWIVALAVADHVAFYSSPDLKHWAHESDFGAGWGSHAGVWECPDLIGMNVEATGGRRFVLLVSVGKGGPNGGSATQYFVGSFDGHRFTAESESAATQGIPRWLDYGPDDYAGVTWSGGPPGDGRRLFLGWMSNWYYAAAVPTERWRGAMTLPRELQLVSTVRGPELRSQPAAQLAALRERSADFAAQRVAQSLELTKALGTNQGLLELDLELDTRDAQSLTVSFSNGEGEHVDFVIDKAHHKYVLDRAASGNTYFSPAFSLVAEAPILGSGAGVSLQAYLDRSSIEIFVNHGESVLTALVFPNQPYENVSLTTDREVQLQSGSVYTLQSIWNGQAP